MMLARNIRYGVKFARSRSSTSPFLRANFSNLMDERERGDENRYFRAEEERKKAELRASFEKLIASESASKDELLELLTPKPKVEEKGIISRLGLDDWKFAVPLGLVVAAPFIAQEIIVINKEILLVGVVFFSASTAYTQFGGEVAKYLDNYSNTIKKNMAEVDESILEESKELLAENKKLLTVEDEGKNLYELVDELYVTQADILNYSAEHKYRDAIVKKLDSLVAIEESVTSAIRSKMVTSVTQDVLTQLKNDKKIRESALDQAIAVLSGGPSGKLGKDIVGSVFQSSLKTFREEKAAKSPELNELLVTLKKDMESVVQPPVVEGEGGNVYVTHRIQF